MKPCQIEPGQHTTVKPFQNKPTGFWGVNTYWAESKQRGRPGLGIPIDQNPDQALEVLKRHVKPSIWIETTGHQHACAGRVGGECQSLPELALAVQRHPEGLG